MSRSTWHLFASSSALIGIVLGLFPLLQWVITQRANGLVSTLFGATAAPAAWLVPAAILMVGIVATLAFGTRGDKTGG